MIDAITSFMEGKCRTTTRTSLPAWNIRRLRCANYAASRIAQSPPEFSYLRKTEPCLQPDVEEVSPCEPVAYGMVSGLARKMIKEA
jgi:hypothetical protein